MESCQGRSCLFEHTSHQPSMSESSSFTSSSYAPSNRHSNITIGASSSSPVRPPASHYRSMSSRSTETRARVRRPASVSSSRKCSSESITSVGNAAMSTPSTSSSESEQEGLIQLVYTSAASARYVSSEEIRVILAGSRDRNASKNITGLLLYREGSFVQFLEGPADEVDALFDKIERDPRHRNMIRVLRQPVTKRDFSHWSMAFRDLDAIRPRAQSPNSRTQGLPGALVDEANDGFSQLMNVGLKVGDHTDYEQRPDAFGYSKLDLPKNMSSSMRKMITTFYKLLDRHH